MYWFGDPGLSPLLKGVSWLALILTIFHRARDDKVDTNNARIHSNKSSFLCTKIFAAGEVLRYEVLHNNAISVLVEC